MKSKFELEEFWSAAWDRHLYNYLQAPPRGGHWIRYFFKKQSNFLEIAAGSCRDSRYLMQNGLDVTGSDFDKKTIFALKEIYPDQSKNFVVENAFNFSFKENQFDVTFSNGFLVLFNDKKKLCELLREQNRITKKYMIFIVHNGDNTKQKSRFDKKSKTDELYNINFFDHKKIGGMVEASGIKYVDLSMHKFGGASDILYLKKIRGFPNILKSLSWYIVPRIYRFQSWENTERIACVLKIM